MLTVEDRRGESTWNRLCLPSARSDRELCGLTPATSAPGLGSHLATFAMCSYGMCGGGNGARGLNLVVRHGDAETEVGSTRARTRALSRSAFDGTKGCGYPGADDQRRRQVHRRTGHGRQVPDPYGEPIR